MISRVCVGSVVLLAGSLAAVGCPPGGWQPASIPERVQVEPPLVLASGLADPSGLAVLEGDWYLLDAAGTQLVQAPGEGGDVVVVLEGLQEASDLASDNASLAIAETGAGRIREVTGEGVSFDLFVDSQTAPSRVIATDAGWAWTGMLDGGESGGLWSHVSAAGTTTALFVSFSDPRGLAATAAGWLVGDEGPERGVFLVTEVAEPPLLLAEVPEEVRDLAVDDEGRIYFTGLAERWPGGGWVYGVDATGDDLEALSYSPPGLGRIAVSGDWIYWASKEAITRAPRVGGDYEVLAHQTRIVDFVVASGQLVWTDSDRGELLAIDLP